MSNKYNKRYIYTGRFRMRLPHYIVITLDSPNQGKYQQNALRLPHVETGCGNPALAKNLDVECTSKLKRKATLELKVKLFVE